MTLPPLEWAQTAKIQALEQDIKQLRKELETATERIDGLERRAPQLRAPRQTVAKDPDKHREHQLRALRARCHRRDLSDLERRKALDKARQLRAIAADFDEATLPWQGNDLLLDPNADPVRASTIPEAAGGFSRLEHNLVMNFWLMSRVARLSSRWSRFEREILTAWAKLRERSGDPEARLDYRFCNPAATVEGAWFPDMRVAVEGTDLNYVEGTALHRNGVWYRPVDHPLQSPRPVFSVGREHLGSSELFALAHRRSGKRTELAMARLARFDESIGVLALIEIAFTAADRSSMGRG